MQKCWFTLRQHYPPPDPTTLRTGHPSGPLSLGHLVPDLRHLDQVLNPHGFEPFPPGMEVFGPRRLVNFKWEEGTSTDLALLGKVGVPAVTGVPGVDATVTVGGLFSRRVRRCSEFECLETWMVNPTRAYVSRALEGEEVREHVEKVKRLGSWSLFMVTGIAVAKGGGRCREDRRVRGGVVGGVGMEVSALVEVGPEMQAARGKTTILEMEHVADFVWAVRLAKITKNGLQSDWKMETFTGRTSLVGRGAVFTPGKTKVDVGDVLGSHGLERVEIVEDPSLDCVFVADSFEDEGLVNEQGG